MEAPSEVVPQILWPEWNDAEYNAEKWDLPVPGKETEVVKFEDPYFVQLPESLASRVVGWMRPHEVFTERSVVVYLDGVGPVYPDLLTSNMHLLDSPIIREIICAVGMVQYIGSIQIFPVERETAQYVASTAGLAWKPWHHVYSANKAGKGQLHKPLINKNGKYIVRLFYLGYWRNILIDDKIPIGENNNIMLPITEFRHDVILWPLFLTKALLKIAALSWTPTNEIVDFDVIQSLTGWIGQQVDVEGLTVDKIWDMCWAYTHHYVWPHSPESESVSTLPKGKQPPKKEEVPLYTYLIVSCSNLSEVSPLEIPGIAPCLDHKFFVEKTRNIPIEEPEEQPELPKWKLHRWLAWAISKGIMPPENTDPPIKSFRMFSILREVILNDVPSRSVSVTQIEEAIRESIAELQPLFGTKSNLEPPIYAPTCIWGDYNRLGPYITKICIYYKPSMFVNKYTITNFPVDVPKDSKVKSPVATGADQTIRLSNKLQISRNQPLYLMTDGIDCKLLVMSLSHLSSRLPTTEQIANPVEMEFINEHPSSTFYRSKGSLVVEKAMWRTVKTGPMMFFLSTYGTTNRMFELKQGRTVARLWVRSATAYVLQILSDTPLDIGDWSKVVETMNVEADRVTNLSNQISMGFAGVFGNMGYPDFLPSLRHFYKTIKPDVNYNIHLRLCVYSDFLKTLNDHLSESSPNLVAEKYALKVLFLDFESCTLDQQVHRDVRSESLAWLKSDVSVYTVHEAAARIQALFKGILVRRLLKHRKLEDLNYKTIADNLKAIYDAYFSASKRAYTIPRVFRSMLKASREDLRPHYSLTPDLNEVIVLTRQTGVIGSIEPHTWVPIVMMTFRCIRNEPVLIRADLKCTLPMYIVRVLDNDKSKEIIRYTNNVLPSLYYKNKYGYTVYAYGWTNQYRVPDVDWKLNIVHIKTEFAQNVECVSTDMIREDLVGNYIPNLDNRICRIVIKIERTCVASFRLHLSYQHARFRLKCLTEKGRVIYQVEATENAIIPPLNFRHDSDRIDEDDHDVHSESCVKLESKLSIAASIRTITVKRANSKRRSKDRRSVRDVRSISQASVLSSKISKVLPEIANETTYYIEAFVLQDSWPLNREEWKVVEENKLPKKVEQPKQPPPTPSKKKAEPAKQAPKGKPAEPIAELKKPFWILSSVMNDVISVAVDTQRQEEIKRMKAVWEEGDPGRAARALEARTRFLEENYIRPDPSSSALRMISSTGSTGSGGSSKKLSKISIEKPIEIQSIAEEPYDENFRTLAPVVSKSKMLPPLDLKQFSKVDDTAQFIKQMILDKLKNIVTTDLWWVKDSRDELSFADIRVQRVAYFQRCQENYETFMEDFMDTHEDDYNHLLRWFAGETQRSRSLLDEAFMVRKLCIYKHVEKEFGPEAVLKMMTGGAKKK